MRILLIDNDIALDEGVFNALCGERYAVDWVKDNAMVLTALGTVAYDLVLLDLASSHEDGLTLLRDMRAARRLMPVLVTATRGAVADRVAGLDAGADEYLVKPYDIAELLARVRALLRRGEGRMLEQVYTWGEVRIVPATHEVTVNGQTVLLSAREWAVLELLVARPGRVLSRQQLEEKLYSWRDGINSNAVEVYIHGVRKKLGSDMIQTVRGLGYLVPVMHRSESNATEGRQVEVLSEA
jgi:two-component system OmpR family response regulator